MKWAMKWANGFACRSGFAVILAGFFSVPVWATTDINWVKNEIDAQQFTSIESFLAALPQDYRTNFTLMYSSGSLQAATQAEPRVISFGTDASLILAYNSGDATLKGSDTVELIQFNQATTNFSFYEISKSAATGTLQLTSESTKCVGCHRSDDPRPNWQPYDEWPGAYGSEDDSFGTGEQAGYTSFLKTAAKNPRYATLLGLPTAADGHLPGTPNDDMVNRISQWNYMRVARLAAATQDYAAYKYAILGSATCSDQFASFFPASKRLPSNWASFGGSSDDWVNAFIYIFASRGIDWQDWTMMIDGVTSQMFDSNPFIAGYTYAQDIVADIVNQDAELKAYAQVSESDSYDNVIGRSVSVSDCTALAALSVKALSAL